MNAAVLIIFFLVGINEKNSVALANKYHQHRDVISLKMNDVRFSNKLSENFNRETSTRNDKRAPSSKSLSFQKPLVSITSLETDVKSDKDKDCFKKEEYVNPPVSLHEETVFTLNFSLEDQNCSNSSDLSNKLLHAPQFGSSTLIKGLILSTIAVFSFIGNVSTLVSILRTRRIGSSTVYLLLAHLAIADLLVTLFCILTEGLWTLTVEWYGSNLMCKVVKFMQMFSLYLSTFVLVLIGFDRLSAVRFPMHRAHAKQHVRRGMACIWLISAIFSFPQMFIFSVMKGPFVEEFYQCVTYAFYTAQWQEQLYTTLTLIFMFLLPLLILITTYTATFVTIASKWNIFRNELGTLSERIMRPPFHDARHKILQKAKVKSLMITVVIVLTFVVCWTPYYIMMIIFMFLDPDEQLSQDLQSAIFFFGSSTAMLNPLIYGAFHLRAKKSSRSKSTSYYNSNSSRTDNTFMTTFRRSHARKSADECVGLHANGSLALHNTREKKSLVADFKSSERNSEKSLVSSF
ncbi:gonadotropin-releasing hormone receptor-like [Argiope bruennichi]|uniref:gonadotropin-releasing hormone receptor-like n=1 Tax=Argiope bruennichi TaxID=94029 RepID=UPI002494B48C|nr:gonadotropin-releasing hormone receptor-like [Argiope bruennichi]